MAQKKRVADKVYIARKQLGDPRKELASDEEEKYGGKDVFNALRNDIRNEQWKRDLVKKL